MQQNMINKSEVRLYVKEIIRQKMDKLTKFIEFTLEASREVKKTPKYDSIREEMQEEIYRLQKQSAFLHHLQKELAKVLNGSSEVVQLGSLVITNKAKFYISVSLGEFFFEGDRMYAISKESPLSTIMMGKKAGDIFTLNNIEQKILEVI